jgi:hypothetical protein
MCISIIIIIPIDSYWFPYWFPIDPYWSLLIPIDSTEAPRELGSREGAGARRVRRAAADSYERSSWAHPSHEKKKERKKQFEDSGSVYMMGGSLYIYMSGFSTTIHN